MMKRYRFTQFSDNRKWYLMPPTIDGPAEFCLDLPSAGLFTLAEWEAWGREYEREEIDEDPHTQGVGSSTGGLAKPGDSAGAPMLPGMES